MQEQKSPIVLGKNSVRKHVRVLSSHVPDVAFCGFLSVLVALYYYYCSSYQVPSWDPTVYLLNARDWLMNTPLYEIYRPPLISWLVAGVWAILGEDWQNVKYVSPIFGIGATAVLYLTLRHHKGGAFALGVAALTALNTQVFFWGSQLLTESLSLFFLLATLYFVKSDRPRWWFVAGACIGLTFASRYPIVLQAGALAVVESYARRNWQILSRAIIGAIPVLVFVFVSMFLKTGTFLVASDPNTHFSILLSPYYVLNSISTWSWIFLLVPLALILRPTYSDRYNYVFIAWFVCSMVFWSANATRVLRFTIQFTPAVIFLALLAVEAFVKNSEPLLAFLRKDLVFLPKKSATQTL